jgi:hypothetical protein
MLQGEMEKRLTLLFTIKGINVTPFARQNQIEFKYIYILNNSIVFDNEK